MSESHRSAGSETFSVLPPPGEPNPWLLNSPHSGDDFPEEFLARSQLSRQTLRRASDLFMDQLILPMRAYGASVMHAHLPRSFLDLNREPLELDPRLISGILPNEANTRSLRVAGGLGTVPRVIGDQVEIYAGKLTLAEALIRIEQHYVPYHLRLRDQLDILQARHGQVVLIDCHSMPSSNGPNPYRSMPDIVLGDRFGTSCMPDLTAAFESLAHAEGLIVERNQPYAGGYITEAYGRPIQGRHALQIEINRALYMDEATLTPHAGFEMLATALDAIFRALFASDLLHGRETHPHLAHAAE